MRFTLYTGRLALPPPPTAECACPTHSPTTTPPPHHLPPCQQVALQRKMFEEYEKRELRRKVAELREVVPDLSDGEAETALRMCDGRWAN